MGMGQVRGTVGWQSCLAYLLEYAKYRVNLEDGVLDEAGRARTLRNLDNRHSQMVNTADAPGIHEVVDTVVAAIDREAQPDGHYHQRWMEPIEVEAWPPAIRWPEKPPVVNLLRGARR